MADHFTSHKNIFYCHVQDVVKMEAPKQSGMYCQVGRTGRESLHKIVPVTEQQLVTFKHVLA
jgi:hypothetical protein